QIALGRGDGPALTLAEARLEAAQAELDLATFDADQLIVRAPFAGDLDRLFVVEGEFVRAGQKLARLSDASQLVAEVPAERSLGAPGATTTLTVEGRDLPARIEGLLPLPDELAVVRELISSPVLARLKLDNPQGQFKAGQTVNSPWLPREPVCVVPVSAVANLPDGRRRVQVLRDSVIRNLSVRILGKVSEELVNVSGRFGPGDELIVASSRELADGTPLKAVVVESVAGGGETKAKKGGTKAPAPPTTGF
ncbi:MAG: efflux RND transporter periplasmic adaptor subunit, partial [Planctomycetaceae bacterium]